MAKNRGAVKGGPTKRGDNFFTRPNKKFNPKNHQKSKFKNDANRSTGEQNFRPSQSGSSDFFVKPNRDELSDKGTQKQIEEESEMPKREKKPFDKKKYRLQKYSKKYKLQQWEDKRKTAVLRGYYSSVKEDEPKFDVKSIYEQHKDDIDSDNDNIDDKTNEENENNLNTSINQANTSKNESESIARGSKEKKNRAFKKAYQEFQRIKEEKARKKEELLKKKAEKEEALQAYKKKKVEKYKKLSRKTKKGQPIMKDRMEMLLEKIQSSMN